MLNSLTTKSVIVAIVSVLLASLYGLDVRRSATILGVFRSPRSTLLASEKDLVIVEGTTHCEDLHYHEPSHSLFTACEDSKTTRHSWWPPLIVFNDVSAVREARGGIFVIDANTKKAQKLAFENFDRPFITHGIDVISDPETPEGKAVYIFAINHLPNPDRYGQYPYDSEKPETAGFRQARSQVEIFHHAIGSSTARHIRSVQHPMITTPNDLLALSPTEFLVTNDHFYAEGHLRSIEDLYLGAKWSSMVKIQLTSLKAHLNASEGIEANVALDKLHTGNGLCHGRTANEIVVAECMSGRINTATVTSGTFGIHLNESIPVDSILDNPSYFSDPFANESFDASGFVVGVVDRPLDLPKTSRDPTGTNGVVVWHVKPQARSAGKSDQNDSGQNRWDRRLIFQDDGSRIRTASTAVLVAVNPNQEDGQRKAWLYVTGFFSTNIIAVKVDL